MSLNNNLIEKSWQNLSSIIDTESVLFECDNNENGTEKTVIAHGPIKSYVSFISIPSADNTDYIDNYAWKKGSRNYLRKGYSNTFTKGVVNSYDFELTGVDNIPKESFLYSGFLITDSNTKWGDTITISIVDVDGIYYPAGSVLDTFIQEIPLKDGVNEISLKSPTTRNTPMASKVPSGIYVRITYTSTGTTDVKLGFSASYRWI